MTPEPRAPALDAQRRGLDRANARNRGRRKIAHGDIENVKRSFNVGGSHISAVAVGVLPLLAVWGVSVEVARAQLRPDELLLVYNTASGDSRRLVDYYAKVRGVPPDRILGLEMPLSESIRPADYKMSVGRIRDILSKPMIGEKIRCLVTFYGVPLKVKAPIPTKAEDEKRLELEKLRDQARQAFIALLKKTEANLEPRTAGELDARLDTQQLGRAYQRIRRRWVESARNKDAAGRAEANRDILTFVERAEGLATALSMMRASFQRPSHEGAQTAGEIGAALRRMDELEQQGRRVEETLEQTRREGPFSPRYGEALKLLPKWRGLFGLYRWLDDDVAWLQGKDCHAAFDSELSLVLWDKYTPYRWQPNLLNPEIAAALPALKEARTLMVGRIDAPTPAIARRMIDDAVAVERKGLTGRCYIDSRGLTGNDLYTQYDRDLVALFDLLRDRSKIPVRIDRDAGLFRPGSCAQTSLYCGWYSLANYVPAFQFQRGAVAWHIASAELESLHHPTKNLWCAGLLRDGVAATLGPTSEPYLRAFPRPSRFFGLLLTGRYTLVECFYRSKPFNSWQFALLGDPLYRPYAKNPQLTLDDLAQLERLGGI